MGFLSKNMFRALLIALPGAAPTAAVDKFHFDIKESIYSDLLQDIAYDTYIDQKEVPQSTKLLVPIIENLDVMSKNADDTASHLQLIPNLKKSEWVQIKHEEFSLEKSDNINEPPADLDSFFSSELYNFKLKIIKESASPSYKELKIDISPHFEKLSNFTPLGAKSNMSLLLAKFASYTSTTNLTQDSMELIKASSNEKAEIEPPSVMMQLKPFRDLKTKQYEHKPPTHSFILVSNPNLEEAKSIDSSNLTLQSVALESSKPGSFLAETLRKRLPFFKVSLFDERIDDLSPPAAHNIEKATQSKNLSNIDIHKPKLKAREFATYQDIRELPIQKDPLVESSKIPEISFAYRLQIENRGIVPVRTNSFSSLKIENSSTIQDREFASFHPPKQELEPIYTATLEVEKKPFTLPQTSSIEAVEVAQKTPKSELSKKFEFKNFHLLEALKFLNPHVSSKRHFSMESLKINKPILVLNQKEPPHVNLQGDFSLHLDDPKSIIALEQRFDTILPSFRVPREAYYQPSNPFLESRLHLLHQEKYTHLQTEDALQILKTEDFKIAYKDPKEVEFYGKETISLEKGKIGSQNNPLHTLSFIHKIKKPASQRLYPIDFTKPYTYEFTLSAEPHKKDLLHSVQKLVAALPSCPTTPNDTYIELLAQNEELYNPQIADLIPSPHVDVRPLIALGKEINRDLRQIADKTSLVPSLFDLNTQILSTEFRTEVEVIAKPNAKGYYFALKLSPFFPEELKRIKQNIYFVIDECRTITKERSKAFKKAILRALPYLYPDDSYNVICFDKHFEKLSSLNLYYSKDSYDKTKRFLDNVSEGSLSPPQDYSKILSYISENFESDPSEINVVILMTDGSAYKAHHLQQEKVLNFTKANNNQFVVYTVTSAQHNYLSGLDLVSFLNKGQMLHSNTNAALPRQLALLIKKLRYPIATNLHLTTLSSTTDNLHFYPGSDHFENFYGHKPLIIYGEADSLAEFEFMIQGKADDEWVNITQSVNLMQGLPGDRELLRDATQMQTKSLHYLSN
jgi:hypothetical protein